MLPCRSDSSPSVDNRCEQHHQQHSNPSQEASPSSDKRFSLPPHQTHSATPPLAQVVDMQLEETIDSLLRFRNESLFTDISIYVEGVEFPCHKVILCAASSYFKAMFTCDLRENRMGKVFIENISPWTMKRLLDFIYTGRIEINDENVIDLFNAACIFQLLRLVDKCTGYIQQHIDLTNCIEINLFATMHSLEALAAETFSYIQDNFMQLINVSSQRSASLSPDEPTAAKVAPGGAAAATRDATTCAVDQATAAAATAKHADNNDDPLYSDFVRLDPKTFEELIKSDLLNVSREIYVYNAMSKWIDHYARTHQPTPTDAKITQMYAALFHNIRLDALSRSELTLILANDNYVKANDRLRDQLCACLNATLSKEQRHNGCGSSSSNNSSSSSGRAVVSDCVGCGCWSAATENATTVPTAGSTTSEWWCGALKHKPHQRQQHRLELKSDYEASSCDGAAGPHDPTPVSLSRSSSAASAAPVDFERTKQQMTSSSSSTTFVAPACNELANSKRSTMRPSTIPRDYLCMLSADRFLFYDFYKSKWDTLASWPPPPLRFDAPSNNSQMCASRHILTQTTRKTAQQYPSSQQAFHQSYNEQQPRQHQQHQQHQQQQQQQQQQLIALTAGYSVCVLNNTLYVMGGHAIHESDRHCHVANTGSSASTPTSSSSSSSSSSVAPSSTSSSASNFSSSSSSESPTTMPSSAASSNLTSGSHVQQLELVDTVHHFDPIRNEWSLCKQMLRKRAFHTAVCLEESTSSQSSSGATTADTYIFLFYGICYTASDEQSADRRSGTNIDAEDSRNVTTTTTTTPTTAASSRADRLTQCFTIEYYNTVTDTWSVLSSSSSLLSHHIYTSFNQYNRSAGLPHSVSSATSVTMSSGVDNMVSNHRRGDDVGIAASVGTAGHAHAISTSDMISDSATTNIQGDRSASANSLNMSASMLQSLISFQLSQAKSIVSLKSLIYILNENCVHCYEFNSKLGQLVCLPYFQLPMSLSSFQLAAAVSVKVDTQHSGGGQQCQPKSLFTWYVAADNEDDDQNGAIVASTVTSMAAACDKNGEFAPNSSHSAPCLSPLQSKQASVTQNAPVLSETDTAAAQIGENECNEESLSRQLLESKREALVFLVNPQTSLIYEFYPAKNKLKKLPVMLLKHLPSETYVLSFKSKLYVTGGLANAEPTTTTSSLLSHNVSNDTIAASSAPALNRPASYYIACELLSCNANSVSSNSWHTSSSSDADYASLIEVFDPETRTWSIFMNNVIDSRSSNQSMLRSLLQADSSTTENGETSSLTTNGHLLHQMLLQTRLFFKLKMSLF